MSEILIYKVLPVIIFIVLPVAIFILAYSILKSSKEHETIKRGIEEAYGQLAKASEKREKETREARELYGRLTSKNLMNHIDENIRYSGIGRKWKFITRESYIVISVIGLVMIFMAAMFVSQKFVIGFLMVVLTICAVEYVFSKIRKNIYYEVEDELLALINSVDNYSTTTADVVSLLEKSARMLNGPLREAILHTVENVRDNGNVSDALRELEDNIEHPFFKTFIRNLEISSRNLANYGDIVTECRSLLQNYLSNTKKLEAIYRDSKIRLVVLVLGGIVCVYMVADMIVEVSIKAMIEAMMGNVFGIVILAYCIAVLAGTLYFAFIKQDRRG